MIILNLPPFSDFMKDIDLNKFSYDLAMNATATLKSSSNVLTQEQYSFLCETISSMMITYLAQYHQWLSAQLDT